MKILKTFSPDLSLKMRGFKLLILDKNSFLWEYGWMKSMEQIRPVDAQGNSVPWINYFFFIEFFTSILQSTFNVFECSR